MVILYPEVVLHKQISTFTITEIFLRISNLQHISPKHMSPPWTVKLLKNNKLRKHQVNLIQKQFKIKGVLAPAVHKISIN